MLSFSVVCTITVCLPLLIFPCTIKSRSSLLALAHLGGPGKRAIKRLWCWCVGTITVVQQCLAVLILNSIRLLIIQLG